MKLRIELILINFKVSKNQFFPKNTYTKVYFYCERHFCFTCYQPCSSMVRDGPRPCSLEDLLLPFSLLTVLTFQTWMFLLTLTNSIPLSKLVLTPALKNTLTNSKQVSKPILKLVSKPVLKPVSKLISKPAVIANFLFSAAGLC